MCWYIVDAASQRAGGDGGHARILPRHHEIVIPMLSDPPSFSSPSSPARPCACVWGAASGRSPSPPSTPSPSSPPPPTTRPCACGMPPAGAPSAPSKGTRERCSQSPGRQMGASWPVGVRMRPCGCGMRGPGCRYRGGGGRYKAGRGGGEGGCRYRDGANLPPFSPFTPSHSSLLPLYVTLLPPLCSPSHSSSHSSLLSHSHVHVLSGHSKWVRTSHSSSHFPPISLAAPCAQRSL